MLCAVCFIFSSCEKDIPAEEPAIGIDEISNKYGPDVDEGEEKITAANLHEHHAEWEEHVHDLWVDLDHVIEEDVVRPDGTVDRVYVVDGDIELSNTPNAYYGNSSIFNACFSNNTNGEFDFYDKYALELIYN